MKNEIKNGLLNLINSNSGLSDIIIYGKSSDKISDLDLIFVYSKLKKKIKIPKSISQLIKDGTFIYVNEKNIKKIFYFEELNLWSIKKKKKLANNLTKDEKKYIKLSSFIDRYYERRCLLGLSYHYRKKNFQKLFKNSNDPQSIIRIINSYLYSIKYFLDFSYEDNLKKEYLKIKKKYTKVRKKFYNKMSKVKLLYNELIKFDNFFFIYSTGLLNKEYPHIRNNGSTMIFQKEKFICNKKIEFDNKKINISNVPYIFITQFFYYTKRNLKISRLLRRSLKLKNFSNHNVPKVLKKIWNIKTKFIDNDFQSLKKANIKTGLYRWSWLLRQNSNAKL